jgi:hypothetical protein
MTFPEYQKLSVDERNAYWDSITTDREVCPACIRRSRECIPCEAILVQVRFYPHTGAAFNFVRWQCPSCHGIRCTEQHESFMRPMPRTEVRDLDARTLRPWPGSTSEVYLGERQVRCEEFVLGGDQ